MEEFININNWPTIKQLEKEYFFKVLKHTNGNKTKASDIMGITLVTLYRKIKKYHRENLNTINQNNEE